MYYASGSISFPVATLIIFFPIFILLMWILEKGYVVEPEKRHVIVRRWLTYITLFIAGLVFAGDLVTILFFFLDGQELTAGFLLKVLTVLVITAMVFLYYISDVREKVTKNYRRLWFIGATVIILASIIWGFAVLGSPRTQQLLKYDQQKINDLQSITYAVENFYQLNQALPKTLDDMSKYNYGFTVVDGQTNEPYEYKQLTATTYEICAVFNGEWPKAQTTPAYIGTSWNHPAGHYCFSQSISQFQNTKPLPVR